MIDIRVATMADADDLFAWRNDPGTLANSRSTAAVTRADHDQWMKFSVIYGYPAHIVLIADSDAGKVGVVRFDAAKDDTMRYEASVTVAPQRRGLGLGGAMLHAACDAMAEYTIDAEIRTGNAASRKIFSSCGFQKVGQRDGFVQYRREAER